MSEKKLIRCVYILIIIQVIFFLAVALLIDQNYTNNSMENVFMIISVIIFVISMFAILYLEINIGSYKCPKCNKNFNPTLLEASSKMHLLNKRYLKCPHCNEKSFCHKEYKN